MQTISIEKLRGQARERVDHFEAKAKERMGALGARTTAGLKQVSDQARAQVDRFETKAKQRLDALVDRVHQVLDLPSHEDIEQVKAKLALLEGRLDDLRAQGGAAAFAVPPAPRAELPEFTELRDQNGAGAEAASTAAEAVGHVENTPASGTATPVNGGGASGSKRRR
jgi:hypothetical protein